MSTSSPGEYAIQGMRISLKLLQDVADGLPVPASIIVNLVQRAVTMADEIHKNQEDTAQLRDQLLRLLPVVMAAIQEATKGKKDAEIPTDLKRNIDHLQVNLEKILEDVTKIKKVTTSKRKRDKLTSFIKSGSYVDILQKCRTDLDWAMREFNVATQLTNSIRICELSRQVEIVSAQVEVVSSQTNAISTNIGIVLTNAFLESLPRSKRASSTCARPDRPVGCFKGTRTGILGDVKTWIVNPNPAVPRCFWLSGIAGIGKTTVAYSVADLARSLGILGADFFFSRLGEDELRDPALVFPTIAYQLALTDPDFARVITAALQSHPDAGFSSLKKQLDTLIIEPLATLDRNPSRVVVLVLDAFDECEPRGAKEILQLLVAALPRLPFFLKIFVTSRPEEHIRSVLVPSTNLHITALHDIETSIVKEDIEMYLTARLRGLPRELGRDGLKEDWIADVEIKLLADAAGTLFIYAETSIRFLSEARNLRKQLTLLLTIIKSLHSASVPPEHLKAFFYLDQLYTQVLLGIIAPTNEAEITTLFQAVVGSVILLRDPLPLPALERLVQLEEGEATDLLACLHSVILPPGPPDYCPRIYHPSFPDFLQSRERCADNRLWIHPEKHEARLALRCLELMNASLHKNMLGKFEIAILNSEIADLDQKLSIVFPPELKYACQHWASHLGSLVSLHDPAVQDALSKFVSQSLLPWLESMSWLGRTRAAVQCLETAKSWLAKSSYSPSVINLVNDVHRLLLAHFPTITASALHLTRSVLPFAPRNIPLLFTSADYADPHIQVVLGTELEWSPCLMTLKGHSNSVRSVAFSSDGTRIVSGSDDTNLRIWDATNGDTIAVLQGHSDIVWSVAYASDGSRIASGSEDRTTRLWDATTGYELLKLEGHAGTVMSVSFSPDIGRIASGSSDESIRVWDVATGDCLATLGGHSASTSSVMFFPDGRRLASGSYDRTTRIWDLSTGNCITVLEGHANDVNSVSLSPNGSRIASASRDETIRIWNVSNETTPAALVLEGHTGPVASAAFSSTGDRIASGSGDKTVRLWDATTGESVATFTGHTDWVRSVNVSPNGRCIVSGSDDSTVKIWDASAVHGNATETDPSHSSEVVSVAFSSDGTRLVSMGWDDFVQIRDPATGHVVVSFEVQAPFTLYRGWKASLSLDNSRIILHHDDASKHEPIAFDASSGEPITGVEVLASDISRPSTPFSLQDNKLLRLDASPPTVICILPPSLPASSIASFGPVEGQYSVAIGSQGGRVFILHVRL